MPTTNDQPAAELDPRFSSEGATPRPWADVLGVIEAAELVWLSTVRRDGRPHVTPLPAMWLDGRLGWPFEVTEEGFRERSSQIAGEEFSDTGTAHVFAVTPSKVLAFGKGEPFSQTRYRFL